MTTKALSFQCPKYIQKYLSSYSLLPLFMDGKRMYWLPFCCDTAPRQPREGRLSLAYRSRRVSLSWWGVCQQAAGVAAGTGC